MAQALLALKAVDDSQGVTDHVAKYVEGCSGDSGVRAGPQPSGKS
jgi:hypothetical protein